MFVDSSKGPFKKARKLYASNLSDTVCGLLSRLESWDFTADVEKRSASAAEMVGSNELLNTIEDYRPRD